MSSNRTFEDIKKDVVDQLYWDYRVDASDITVSFDDGTLVLSGTVPSYTAKDAAEDDAWSVQGVSILRNDLTVSFPEEFIVPDDEEIKNNVETSLILNNNIDSTKFEISVVGGIVSLEGSVDSYWKKLEAETVAKNKSGVIDVINKIAIVPTESFIDEDIAEDIVNSLARSVSVDVDNVDVKVKDGVATLSGKVLGWNAYDAAMDAARYTAGVIDIKDNLIIESM